MRQSTTFRDKATSSLRSLAGSLALLVSMHCGAQTGALEHAVKATYLIKFASFIEWPAASFNAPTDPLTLCVVGADSVSDLVDAAARDQSAAGHAIAVQHVSAASAREARCHMMYVAVSPPEAAAALLDRIRDTPVLTVTDAARSARSKGMINFIIQDNRVRFEIDLPGAAESRLVISSKLLDLAVRVSPKP